MLDIQENISLKNYNTFRIDAKAKFFVKLHTEDELMQLIKMDIRNQYPHFFLGGGSNTLFTKDFDGIVVKNDLLGKEILYEDNDHVYLKIASGELRPLFVNRCIENAYQGIENLVLIPGTVGASAVGNIGAYGSEAKDIIEEVEYIDLIDYQKKTIKNSDCKFDYRDSIFKHELKNKIFITHIIFKLKKTKDILHLKNTVKKIIEQRTAKLPDPEQIGTAGSFFKNPIIKEQDFLNLKEKWPMLVSRPVYKFGDQKNSTSPEIFIKLSAGQLIELCGLKGYRMGQAGVSSQHALVLINLGNCSGQEIVSLANFIVKQVKEKFGITLEAEVIYV